MSATIKPTTGFVNGKDYVARMDVNFREGTHVPGYIGYCPQLKYDCGKTYGTNTHDLATQQIAHKVPADWKPQPYDSGIPDNLPKANGRNRMTQGLIPGYTGFVPRMNFKYAQTYRETADHCVDEWVNKPVQSRVTYTQQGAGMGQPGQEVHQVQRASEKEIAQTLDSLAAKFEKKRKPADEAPMVGFGGHIPRKGPTQVNVGHRHHEGAQGAVDDFWARTMGGVSEHEAQSSKERIRRVYQEEGMKPRFDGFVPQFGFQYGRTYGDTTRNLDVCNHNAESYGATVRSAPAK